MRWLRKRPAMTGRQGSELKPVRAEEDFMRTDAHGSSPPAVVEKIGVGRSAGGAGSTRGCGS
eukprot:11920320-Alexandrium_andersonii.AAC.1